MSLAPTLALTLSLTLAIYFSDGLTLVSTATSFTQAEGEHGVLLVPTATSFTQAEGEHGVFSSDSSSDTFLDSSYLFQ